MARDPDASPARTMLMKRSEKYSGWVARLSASELAAFEDAQHVEDDEAEVRAFGEFAGDGEGAVERDAGVEQGGEFLGEEEDVAAASAAKAGSLSSKGFFGRDADVDGSESLLAQFAGDEFVGFAGEAAGAEFAIGGDGAEEKGRQCAPPARGLVASGCGWYLVARDCAWRTSSRIPG